VDLDRAATAPLGRDGAPGDRPPSRAAGIAITSVVVLVVLLVGAVLVAAQRPGDGLPADARGATAPPFVLPTLGGDELALEALADGPVVLTFWASWCTTCKADVPKLQRTVDTWGDEGVTVVGVVIDDTLVAARAAADQAAMRYPSVFDADGDVKAAYGVVGTPETFLLAPGGQVVDRWIGPLPAYELDLRLAALTDGSTAPSDTVRSP
jgi:cytochrome c biogenesis protein CcmG, thiol:disulfide interchange protein DsbE